MTEHLCTADIPSANGTRELTSEEIMHVAGGIDLGNALHNVLAADLAGRIGAVKGAVGSIGVGLRTLALGGGPEGALLSVARGAALGDLYAQYNYFRTGKIV